MPLDITEGVRLEDVSLLIPPTSFDFVRAQMGTYATTQLERCHYALIERFEPQSTYDTEKRELFPVK